MKILYSLLLVALLSINSMDAQSTYNRFNYQAVLRSDDGSVMADRSVQVRFSIMNGEEETLYQEIHDTQSDGYGMINLVIGDKADSTSFADIHWGEEAYFLSVEIQEDGEVLLEGKSEILGVPYASISATAPKGEKGDSPEHIWDGTFLSFQNADGSFGDAVDLRGPEGPQGKGITIKGSVENPDSLPTPYEGNEGDIIIVASDGGGYIWNGETWVEIGKIQGPEAVSYTHLTLPTTPYV